MAIEDFTTYTEVDTNNKLTVTASKALAADADQDEVVYLYDDKDANHFDALDIDFEIRIESTSDLQSGGNMGLSDTVGDYSNWEATSFAGRIYRGSTEYRLNIMRGYFVALDYYVCSADTIYYCTATRPAGNDVVHIKIYSDAERTNELDDIFVANFGAAKWQYVYGFTNRDSGNSGRNFDGYVQNLNLNEAVAGIGATAQILHPWGINRYGGQIG